MLLIAGIFLPICNEQVIIDSIGESWQLANVVGEITLFDDV